MNTLPQEKIEDTIGYKVAITFKPFIDPKCSEHMEIVKDMSRAINRAYDNSAAFHKGYEEGSEALAKEHGEIDVLRMPLFLKENEEYCKKCNGTGVVAYKGQETGEWQLCPKCAGEGQIYRQDVRNDTTALSIGWFICDVCNGAKILARPESVPPYKDAVNVIHNAYKELPESPLKSYLAKWFEYSSIQAAVPPYKEEETDEFDKCLKEETMINQSLEKYKRENKFVWTDELVAKFSTSVQQFPIERAIYNFKEKHGYKEEVDKEIIKPEKILAKHAKNYNKTVEQDEKSLYFLSLNGFEAIHAMEEYAAQFQSKEEAGEEKPDEK